MSRIPSIGASIENMVANTRGKPSGPYLVVALLATCLAMHAAEEIHVAANGKDENNGNASAPVASLKRAQELGRKAGKATIIVHEGTWFLPEPLTFTAEDSGCTWRAAEGRQAILSGGQKIGGWSRHENGIWSAPVPNAKDWYFRELFVDGKRAIRARFPNQSAKPSALRLEGYKTDKNEMTMTVDPAVLADWKNLNDVEIVVNINWASFHKRIKDVDRQTGVCTMMPPHSQYTGRNAPSGKRYFWFENALELLDEPGEWYLDRSQGKVFYMPRAGEDLEKAEVIAPRLEHVLLIEGAPGKPVENLAFQGLTFSHNFYTLPDIGHHGRQACFQYGGDEFNGLPAMLQAEYAQNVSIVGCTIVHGGSNGIELRAGCRNSLIEGNAVHDLAGNGIGIGSKNEESIIPEKNRIVDNYVHDCGAVFLGACGIWVGYGREIQIAHNLVEDLPYTGISVGWNWKPTKTLVRDNVIEWNHVHDVMQDVSDGGAIYTLGCQPGTVIRFNHLHDVKRGPYAHQSPNHALYFDAGSSSLLVQSNLAYRIANEPTRFKEGPECYTLENNILSKGDNEDKSALPEVRAKAGLEAKWKALKP